MTSDRTPVQRTGFHVVPSVDAVPPLETTVAPADIRPLMSGFPTGVSVITARTPDGIPWGMTCTSLCSVSLDPPTLLVCLRSGSPTLAAVQASGSYAVNLLHDLARPTAELFASGAPDRFERIEWRHEEDAGGPHLVDSAHTIADCVVVNEHRVGDHTMVLGHVRTVTELRAQHPLLYGMRRYSTWIESTDEGHLYYDFIS